MVSGAKSNAGGVCYGTKTTLFCIAHCGPLTARSISHVLAAEEQH
jgi:hypothetical protein